MAGHSAIQDSSSYRGHGRYRRQPLCFAGGVSPLQASSIVGGDLIERPSASPDRHALGHDKEKSDYLGYLYFVPDCG